MIDKEKYEFYIITPDYKMTKFNKVVEGNYADIKLGDYCYEKTMNRKSPCEHCPIGKTGATMCPIFFDPLNNRWMESFFVALDDGTYAVTSKEITDNGEHAFSYLKKEEKAQIKEKVQGKAANKELAIIKEREKIEVDIANSLLSKYMGLYYIDLEKKTICRIMNDSIITSLFGEPHDIEEVLSYVNEDVVEHFFQEASRKFHDLSTLEERLNANNSIAFEYIKKNNGWARSTMTALKRDENGRIIAVLYTVQSIQNEKNELKKEREAALRDISNYNETTLTLHQALKTAQWQVRYNDQGEIGEVIWTDEFRNLIGYKNTEDFPDNWDSWFDLLYEDDKEKTLEAYQKVVDTPDGSISYNVTYRLLTKDRGYRWFRAAGRLKRHPDGSPDTYYGFLSDIDEQKKLQEQLASKQEELQKALEDARRASEAKSNFLFNMSHDIRTPMNAIISLGVLMKRHIDDKELLDSYIEKLNTSSDLLLSLINNVLEMARIETGNITLNEKMYDSKELNEEIFSIFEDEFKKKNVTFTVTSSITHKNIMIDETKIKEIYLNVLSNALKYTPKGGKVSVYLQELPSDKEGYIVYKAEISDTGIGMSKEFLPRIFDEFTRERTSTESKVSGTGLGMAIVKNFVELMGGTIDIQSELGKGTKVTFAIPHRLVSEEEIKGTKERTLVIDYDQFKGKRILLAEDNDLNAEIAQTILEEAGFIVDRAEDGIVCVSMLEKAEPGYYDVILMDIQMPNMDGYKATRVIRKMDLPKALTPILAMTANAFEEDKQKALDSGMNGHISKPINLNVLFKSLEEILK